MKNSTLIIGIHVQSVATQSAEVQKVLTEFGCSIRTRVGLHQVEGGACELSGLILIEFAGSVEESEKMIAKLSACPGVTVKTMAF